MLVPGSLEIEQLQPIRYRSPLAQRGKIEFIPQGAAIPYQEEIGPGLPDLRHVAFEKAGPREQLYFDGPHTTAAIVTCGGLCPGINNVVRALYLELKHNYRVERILGIQNGYKGLNPAQGKPPIPLTDTFVDDLHNRGGTVLGSSRGPQDVGIMADFLQRENIDILFCIGGEGTQRGALAIHTELRRRGLNKALVGIPKTIDNDIPLVSRTFGFVTAVEEAEKALRGAHVEARGAENGIGLVKLMGRYAGFIAANAALASQEANFVLVPEVKFPLDGPDGLLAALERRLEARAHALVVVAEGAGQDLCADSTTGVDASGNPKLTDIGVFLREKILAHFKARHIEVALKYIDPSYLIRSVPANAYDRILTNSLGRAAAHAAMAGKTGMMVGYWGSEFTHIPICEAVATKKQLDIRGDLWSSVLSSTGQPCW